METEKLSSTRNKLHIYLIFVLKSFICKRMLLIYELVRCAIVVWFIFSIKGSLSSEKNENKDFLCEQHSLNQSFCTQNRSIDIQKAAYKLCQEVVNIRNIIFVAKIARGCVKS